MIRYISLLLFIGLAFWGCEEEVEEDTTPPTVSISSHSSGQTVYEIVSIIVTTQDNDGISKVEFFIDDSLVLTDTESPYEHDWNTTQYEDNSEHIVKVISYDNSENFTESQPILLRVDNSTSRPTPSALAPIIYDNGFQISWSQNNNDDFQSYILYESPSEDMSNQVLVYETENITDITYFKTLQNFRYYQIVVEDIWGLQSKSNVEVGDYYVELWGNTYSVLNTIELILWGGNGPQLTGSIPPEIGNLTNLTYLNLGYNQLTGEIPPEIGNLTNLTSLYLFYNELTGSIPPNIGNLTNLERLIINNNQLTGSIPPEIGNLTNLTDLELQNNQLTGEIPESICNLVENDCAIDIYNNQLCPPYPSCIEDYVGEQNTSDCP